MDPPRASALFAEASRVVLTEHPVDSCSRVAKSGWGGGLRMSCHSDGFTRTRVGKAPANPYY